MRTALWIVLNIIVCSVASEKLINEYVVKIKSGYSSAQAVARRNGMILLHKMIGIDDHYVMRRNDKLKYVNDDHHLRRLKRNIEIEWIEQQVELIRVKRAVIKPKKNLEFSDPLYNKQWHLRRSLDNPTQYDMNVLEAWNLGYTGKGVVATILDDGIDHQHSDLKRNYDPRASYDVNGHDPDPMYNLNKPWDNKHGTRCAGEVAAVSNNDKCGVGVAFDAKIGGVRILDGSMTDRVEAEGLGLNQQHINIYSASWGPNDDGRQLDGPHTMAKAALERGILTGRNSLGNIFVWASGNGGGKNDSCACDGYASSIYTLSVSSVSEFNQKPWYLEKCASTMVSTYSSGSKNERKITTTDIQNKCTLEHTGTSASAPLAAGVVALLLEANPKLTWRDVQYISIICANTKPFNNDEFIINGANRKVSSLYGFGLMDAGKMVRLGRIWHTLPEHRKCQSSRIAVNKELSGYFSLNSTFKLTGCSGRNKINYLEQVVLKLKIDFTQRGALQIFVISPSGTRSELLPPRVYDKKSGNTDLDKWPLSSVQFWGETCHGIWTVEITNKFSEQASTQKGKWYWSQLIFYGTETWPIRVRKPTDTGELKDNWFKQFERFVVDEPSDPSEVDKWLSRGYADTDDGSKPINHDCDNECEDNKCTGPGPKNCEQCKNYKTYSDECVEQCPKGTYLKYNSTYCDKCHFSCDECIGPSDEECSRCHEFDSKMPGSNKCKMATLGCPVGYYKDSKTNKCNACSKNCAVCTSSTHCSECSHTSHFVLTLNFQCKPSCTLGSFSDGRGRCHVCPLNCLECVSPDPNSSSIISRQANCISCSNNYYILSMSHIQMVNGKFNGVIKGKCVNKCPYGFFMNETAAYCYQCHRNCKSCTDSTPNSCTECRYPLIKEGNTCIDPVIKNCIPNSYRSSNGSCLNCPSKCKTCIQGKCTSCSTSFPYQFKDDCVSECPPNFLPHTIIKQCLPCDIYCPIYDTIPTQQSTNQRIPLLTNEICSKYCFTNKISPNNQLQTNEYGSLSTYPSVIIDKKQQCQEHTYWDRANESCQPCHVSCGASCHGNTSNSCTSCPTNSILVANQHTCQFTNQTCPNGTYLHDHTICIPCHLSCNNKSCNPINGNCQSCPIGHKKSTNQKPSLCARIITCNIDQFWNQNENKCQRCKFNCRTCSSSKSCTTCHRGNCIEASTGICHPCCHGNIKSSHCLKCKFGEDLCVFDSSETKAVDLFSKNKFIDSFIKRPIVSIVVLILTLVILFIVMVVMLNHRDNTPPPTVSKRENKRSTSRSTNNNNNNSSRGIKYKRSQYMPLLDDNDDDEDDEEEEMVEFINHDKYKVIYDTDKNCELLENGDIVLPSLKSNGTINSSRT